MRTTTKYVQCTHIQTDQRIRNSIHRVPLSIQQCYLYWKQSNGMRSIYEGLCSTPQWWQEQLWGTVLYTTMMWGAAMRDCALHHKWCEEQLWVNTMMRGAAMRDCAVHHKWCEEQLWVNTMMRGAAMRDCALHHNDDRSSYEGLCSRQQWYEEQLLRDCSLDSNDVRRSYEGLYFRQQWSEEQLWGPVP
jgi:hypothetical protein